MARQYVRKGQAAPKKTTKKMLTKAADAIPDKLPTRIIRMEEALAQALHDIRQLQDQVDQLQQDQQRMAILIPPTNAVGAARL